MNDLKKYQTNNTNIYQCIDIKIYLFLFVSNLLQLTFSQKILYLVLIPHSQSIGFETRGSSIKTQLLLNIIESISTLIDFILESYIFQKYKAFSKVQDHFPQRILQAFVQDYTLITFDNVNNSFSWNKIWIKIFLFLTL